VQRNQAAVVGVVAVAGALVAGTALATWQAVRATRAETAALESEAQAREDRALAEDQRQVAERRAAEARENEQKARAAEATAKESDATATAVLEFVKNNIFAAAAPPLGKTGLGRDITLRQALDSAEPKIAAAFVTRPRVEAQLRSMLAFTYLEVGEGRLGLAQLERAYALAEQHYGLDHEFTMEIEYVLASNYISTGRSVEGFRLLEESLARRRRTLGREHPMTVLSLVYVIAAYTGFNRTEDAKKLGAELVQLGPKAGLAAAGDPEQLLRASFAYSAAGRVDEAARLVEEALPRLTAKLGSEDFQVLQLRYNLGLDYYQLGRTTEAVAMLEPAYQSAVRTLGPINAFTLMVMQSLTAYSSALGRNEAVVRILEAALPALRHELGPAHPKIAPHVINLSVAYLRLARYRQAVKLIEETIAAIPEKDRVAYINFDFMQGTLIDGYLSLEDRPSARRVLADRERYMRSRDPAESFDLAGALLQLGLSMLDMDLFAQAERVFREAFNICKAKQPTGRRTVAAKVLLGVALAGQKQFAEAESLLATGCDELKARWPEISPQGRTILAQGWMGLAQLYEGTARGQKAIEVCRQASSFWESQNSTGADNLYNAACLRSVGAAVLKSALGSDASQRSREEADRAFALLKQAVAAGFKDVALMKRDHGLDALRGREDFKNLLIELKPKP
jgi:tetratricopeptide (TPR) repeat protein